MLGLTELERIVVELAELDSLVWDSGRGCYICGLCGKESFDFPDSAHDPDCLWLQAVKASEAIQAARDNGVSK